MAGIDKEEIEVVMPPVIDENQDDRHDPNVIKLEEPVTIRLKSSAGEREERRTELVFKAKPKGKDYRALDFGEGQMDRLISFAARLTGVPVSVIDELDRVDFWKVMARAKDFLPDDLGI